MDRQTARPAGAVGAVVADKEDCEERKPKMTPDELSERLLMFAVRIAKVVEELPDTPVGRHVAGQLLRAGTSPGPNYEEGCAAESKADFAHKLSIALKELRESRFWLRFIVRAGLLPERRMTSIIDEAQQLRLIIGKSVTTAKRRPGARRAGRPDSLR